jgi:hypothetical protein
MPQSRVVSLAVVGLAAVAAGACTAASGDPTSNRPRDTEVPRTAGRSQSFTDAEYAGHIRALRAKLAKQDLDHLNVRIEDPFVVVGDGTMADLERSSRTVRWASDKLEQDFFDKRPSKILDIYLFTTADSYERGVKRITGESPSTPYGFYSSSNGAMFMNIATGGGTLVHEIVHPYVEADFPSAPPWLNEGLGSLFEQSSERDGHIVGLTNWRLEGLQKAIRRGGVPAFSALTSMTNKAFYDSGTSYSQSRYLMYYLQEQGLLRKFYEDFRAARKTDPSGYQTLVRTLGERDLTAFKQRWERYVSELRFP